MKRFLLLCVVSVIIYACSKETDPVYDTHLFQALQAHAWILDSAKFTDSASNDSSFYAVDSVNEITRFNSQQYTINHIKPPDSTFLDTVSYQAIYDNPSRIYYYNNAEQQVLLNQYIDIDTVNAEMLILTKTDTFKTVSRNYYHAY